MIACRATTYNVRQATIGFKKTTIPQIFNCFETDQSFGEIELHVGELVSARKPPSKMEERKHIITL